jgi:hypothetical protein
VAASGVVDVPRSVAPLLLAGTTPTLPPAAEPDTRKPNGRGRRQDDGAWAMWLDMFHSDGGA